MCSSSDSNPVNCTKPDAAAEPGPVNHEEVSGQQQADTNSTSGPSSFTRFPNQISNMATETLKRAKETDLDGAVPVATGAIQTVHDQIRYITAQSKENEISGTMATPDERECIEHMDTERVCDFLREKHMSTAPLPRRN